MLLSVLDGRRVVFVGGKGGVGKTSVSAGLAHACMLRGQRVLLVSTDPAHNLGHLWERKVGDAPTRLAERGGGVLDGIEIDPAKAVDRHFDAVQRQMEQLLPERLHGPAKRHLAASKAAPGSHESAILERVAEAAELGMNEYDLVVFDTAPTGHTLRLLSLPEQLTDWAESLLRNRSRSEHFQAAMSSLITGREEQALEKDAALRRTLIRRRERFVQLHDVISEEAGFVLVTVAEPMPMAESLELALHLDELHIHLSAVVVNRRSPADAGPLLAERRGYEDLQLERLRRVLPSVPIEELPLLSGHLAGEEGVAAISSLLG